MPWGEDYPYAAPPQLPEGDVVDIEAFLPGSGPLELEIGPGRGGFILERAVAEPGVRIIGLEVRRKWSTVVDRRLERDGLSARARVLCEDARLALPRMRPEGALARVFIHFPDPWWKKRHQKRLVVIDPLIDEVVRLLCDDGELFVQTDVAERADEYEARIGQHAALFSHGDAPDSPRVVDNPYAGRSNRERRADSDGLPVYRMRFRRRPR
jgi:tRNA (guanine-N7-)-methyltransferase